MQEENSKVIGETRPRSVMYYLWPGLRSQPLRLGFAIGCLFLSVLLRIVEPWPLQYVIDGILMPTGSANNATQHTLNWFPANDNVITTLTYCAVALVLIAASRALADYYRAVTFSIIGNRIVTQLRAQVFRHVQSLSLGFHQRSRTGDLTVRLVGDLNMLKDVAVSAALPLLSSLLILVGMMAYMLYLNWRLGLLVMAVIPAFWLLTLRSSKKIRESAKKQRRREGALAATAAESMTAVRSVQAHGASGIFENAFTAHNTKSQKEGVRTSRLTAGLERSVDIMIAVASAIVLWQGTRLVLTGALTPGGLIVYLAYLKRGFKPLQDFAKYTGRLSKAMAAGTRITELLEQTPSVVDSPDAVEAPPLRGQLTLRNINFSYDESGPVVLENFSLDVEAGQHIAIVGPSGVGKSTLFALLMRLYNPTSGQVMIDGNDIRSWTLASLRERMGIVLQDTALFAATVADNIALATADATQSDIEAAARIAQAHTFIQNLPLGYEEVLGERGVNLSQGQRQRIAIARAALRRSPILLLDEPTSSLDAESRQQVMTALRSVSEGRTTLLVTHDIELAAWSDRVLYLGGPGYVEFGSHEELLAKGGGYARLAHIQNAAPGTEGVTDALRC